MIAPTQFWLALLASLLIGGGIVVASVEWNLPLSVSCASFVLLAAAIPTPLRQGRAVRDARPAAMVHEA